MKKLNLILIFFALMGLNVHAQDKAKQALIGLKNKFYADFLEDQKAVKAYVAKTGKPSKWNFEGKTFEIQKFDKTGKPIIAATESNVEAANTTGASSAWTGGLLGLNLQKITIKLVF